MKVCKKNCFKHFLQDLRSGLASLFWDATKVLIVTYYTYMDKEKKKRKNQQTPPSLQSLSYFPAVKLLEKSLNIVLLLVCQIGPSYVPPAALLHQGPNRWKIK